MSIEGGWNYFWLGFDWMENCQSQRCLFPSSTVVHTGMLSWKGVICMLPKARGRSSSWKWRWYDNSTKKKKKRKKTPCTQPQKLRQFFSKLVDRRMTMEDTMQHAPGLRDVYWWRTKFICEMGRKNQNPKALSLHSTSCRAINNEKNLKESGRMWLERVCMEERRGLWKKFEQTRRSEKKERKRKDFIKCEWW